jgi:hypothetical protein
MALWDEVAARYSARQLVALTNPDEQAPTTVGAVRRDAAVADAMADFATYARVAYDGSDPAHVAAAVEGVVAYLIARGGAAAGVAASTLREYRDKLRMLRPRLLPTTESRLEPVDEFANRERVRPDFDRDRFRHIIPDGPRPGGSDDE